MTNSNTKSNSNVSMSNSNTKSNSNVSMSNSNTKSNSNKVVKSARARLEADVMKLVDCLTYSEISKLVKHCQRIQKRMLNTNFSPNGVFKGNMQVRPKYMHPTDKTITWSGRGKWPKWVDNWVMAGGEMDDLLIDVVMQADKLQAEG